MTTLEKMFVEMTNGDYQIEFDGASSLPHDTPASSRRCPPAFLFPPPSCPHAPAELGTCVI